MNKLLSKKNGLRLENFRFLSFFGENIRNKLNNICGKVSQYYVPDELWQNRNKASNRVLLPWKSVLNNNLTYPMLDSFENGVTVEFTNNDFFDTPEDNELFQLLKTKLGSDENVSSMISIRSEAGDPSSRVPRQAFAKLLDNTEIQYKGSIIVLNEDNYLDYKIKQDTPGGTGNEKWSGFLFISIRGGQQDSIESHAGDNYTIFNPAISYSSSDVSIDIDLVLSYFALLSIDEKKLKEADKEKWLNHQLLLKKNQKVLKEIKYDYEKFSGNLLDYVQNQYSVSLIKNQLTDPIQIKKIEISDFDTKNNDPERLDLSHEEAVIYDRYYWDKEKKCILSPSRPTNLFWLFHYSNMLQQNYSLDEFFENEQRRVEMRNKLLKKTRE